MNHQPTRRAFLSSAALFGASAVAAACAPSQPAPTSPVSSSSPAASRAWEKQWEDLVAAAKKEGLIIYDITRSSSGAQAAIPAFTKAFPGITVEQTTSGSAAVFSEQVIKEQSGGVFSWDLFFMSNAPYSQLIPAGALAPLKPLIFHPEALDDKAWDGGFEAGWSDKDKKWGYSLQSEVGFNLWINTDLVREGEMKSLKDLLDPKWKGKMIMADPRVNGFGYTPLTAARLAVDDAVLKRILVDQAPVFSRDTRQLTEFMVRGQYSLALGVVPAVLAEFQKEGLGKNLKMIYLPEFQTQGTGKQIWLPKQVPHPNGAKLFVNWLLTKEGNAAWCQATEINSRRKDVAIVDPSKKVDPNTKYHYLTGPEDGVQQVERTVELAKELLK
ncbi:MAG: extracellular solute-binding protein [Dehalococcoidia bacterium]|nr:extracellular solute-binding protein [Dehalococcoidia bacterium]